MTRESISEYLVKRSNSLKITVEELVKSLNEVSKDLTEAAQQGDLSENAAYHDAKDKYKRISLQIHRKETEKAIIDNIKILDYIHNGTVQELSIVKLDCITTGEQFDILVTPQGVSNPTDMLVSITDPITRNMVGLGVGDTFEVKYRINSSSHLYKITEID